MDKIYSRKGIRIKRKDIRLQKKSKLKIFFILFFIIFITALSLSVKSFIPIFEAACEAEAKSIATQISNEEADKLMKTYEYQDLVYIEKDENGEVVMIRTNVAPINNIMSDVALHIQEKLDQIKDSTIYLKAGSFSGMNIFSGIGPSIPIKILANGNVETNLKSEFTSVGVNQTLHRVYAELDSTVTILTPFRTMEENIKNQILITESVILGEVPSTYYNLDKNSDVFDDYINDDINLPENDIIDN